jgi:NAD(P)-dependent dehydrogenase (short-subunit alcohol dehydrogenase family)
VKTVLITGSSSGIGKATAIRFARQGWRVAATMRNPEREEYPDNYPDIRSYALDVTQDEETIASIIQSIISDMGAIDVVVNNAGIGVFGVFEAADFAMIKKQFDTNLFGLMRVTQSILPHFRERRTGVIVNVSSGVGRIALPLQSLYNATKFAIEGFSESLQYELAPLGIRVKLVEPGNIKTKFFQSLNVIKNDKLPEYQSYHQKVLANHFKLDATGASPEMVARVIYHAANDEAARLRYPAGKDVAGIIRIRKLLPERMFFRLVRSQLEK